MSQDRLFASMPGNAQLAGTLRAQPAMRARYGGDAPLGHAQVSSDRRAAASAGDPGRQEGQFMKRGIKNAAPGKTMRVAAIFGSASARPGHRPWLDGKTITVFRLRSPVRLARRAAMCLCVAALVATGTGVAGQASQAWACDTSAHPNHHCYAFAQASGSVNHGGYGQLSDNCLYMPPSQNFVTQEIWDGNGAGKYWTEVGLISGGFDGGYYSHQWFWGDSRPIDGGGFNFHAVDGTAGPGGPFPVETTYIGNNEWNVYGGTFLTLLGTSTNQPETSSGVSSFGTEYTANPGSGMRDLGTQYNLQWQGTGGQWHYEGGLAHARNAGPGPFQVTPAYNPSNSSVSLGGPC
jgi:hypothetical protein